MSRGASGVSRPISRVLSGGSPLRDGHSSGTPLARRLEQPTRAAAGIEPGTLRAQPRASRAAPIRSCSRWGLPCRCRCRQRGALLPHRFTLALAGCPAPAVSSLWHFPWGRPRRPLAATVDPWSPDFPPPRAMAAKPACAAAAVRPAGAWNKGSLGRQVKGQPPGRPVRSPPERAAAVGRAAVAALVAVAAIAAAVGAAAGLDAALRLTAHQHDEIGALAGLLGAHGLVRDDQRGAGRHDLVDALDGLLRDGDALERRLGRAGVGCSTLGLAVVAAAAAPRARRRSPGAGT